MNTAAHLLLIAAVAGPVWIVQRRVGIALWYALLIDSGVDALIDIPKAAATSNIAWLAAELAWLTAAGWAANRVYTTLTRHRSSRPVGPVAADDTARLRTDVTATTASNLSTDEPEALVIRVMEAIYAHPDNGRYLSDLIAADVADNTGVPIDTVFVVLDAMRTNIEQRHGIDDHTRSRLFGHD